VLSFSINRLIEKCEGTLMKRKNKTSDTERRILDCAEDLFSQKGYHGTSTREIATAAGISIQTLHYHCDNKKALYEKVLSKSVVAVTEMINRHVEDMLKRDINKTSVIRESIERMIDELVEVFHRNPNYPLLFFRQWGERDNELRKVEWEQMVPYLRTWIERAETVLDAERTRGIDLALSCVSLAIVWWGLFSNPTFIGPLLDLEAESDEYVERMKTHIKGMTLRLIGVEN